jgi:protein TonB
MARRKLLIGVSIAGHAALFAGVLGYTVWDLEQVDYRPKVRTSLAVITPPAAEAGPRTSTERQQRKEPPKIAKDLTQPQEKPPATPLPGPAVTTDDGTGAGPGGGTGGGDGPPGGDLCADPGADPGGCEVLPEPPLLPDPPKPPPQQPPRVQNVTPQILKGLRTSGETAIHPPREVVQEMHHSGDLETSASIKLCLDPQGQVASITLTKSTRYAAYDEAILAAARRWRYQPYTVNGIPAPACGMVTFRYKMK